MSPRNVSLYLSDIIDAAEAIRSFTAGKTFADYTADNVLRSAVERQFIVIGEALNQAIQLDNRFADRITDASRIVRVRHRLTHGYFAVADDIIWGIIERHLEGLLTQIRGVLSERSSD